MKLASKQTETQSAGILGQDEALIRARDIVVRPCASLEEIKHCVSLQRTIWGLNPEDLVPQSIFIVSSKIGGQILGAFDGTAQIGFSIALPAFKADYRYLHSHMVGVLPRWRNRGVGRQIKLKQREEALSRGIQLIEWTFDPLELVNAYLNISRLGAIARRFEPNLYGLSSSRLHAGLPTDRLVAEWWLSLGRVKAATCKDPIAIAADSVRISVPLDIQELKKSGSAKALEIQDTVRRSFSDLFKQGYGVTGFAFETRAGVYILEKQEMTRLPPSMR